MAFADDVKNYARADDAEDIAMLIGAAEAYLANAGIAVQEGSPLYALAVGMLVTHWCDDRDPVAIGAVTQKMKYSLEGIIQQLQLSGGGANASGQP